jgi:hypothetical protein
MARVRACHHLYSATDARISAISRPCVGSSAHVRLGNSGLFLTGKRVREEGDPRIGEWTIRSPKTSPARTIPILKYWREIISLHTVINWHLTYFPIVATCSGRKSQDLRLILSANCRPQNWSDLVWHR